MVAVVRTFWSGTTGGPGLSQMVISGGVSEEWNPGGAQGAANAVRKFWDALKVYLPNELVLTVSPTVDWYNTETGVLGGSVSAATPPPVVIGSGSGSYAGGAGVKMMWETGQIRNGRRVRGATYVVPAEVGTFNNTGMVGAIPRGVFNAAGTTLIADLSAASTSLMVWSRPREATAELPARTGQAFQVTSASCSSKSAILRGRRD